MLRYAIKFWILEWPGIRIRIAWPKMEAIPLTITIKHWSYTIPSIILIRHCQSLVSLQLSMKFSCTIGYHAMLLFFHRWSCLHQSCMTMRTYYSVMFRVSNVNPAWKATWWGNITKWFPWYQKGQLLGLFWEH